VNDRLVRWRALLDRFEAGDAVLFLYIAVIARQYICWIPVPNAFAWFFAAIVGALVLAGWVVAKDETRQRISLPFWMLVVLPLAFAFLLRLPFPDVSFDVLNYRLFHGIRALDGFLYRAGDFFPTPAPYNTAPDMVMGITRILFGYRLGTIVNLFALLWTGRILDRLLRLHVPGGWWRVGAVLLVLAVEHIFFEIDTYMIDLLALPLLLEATRLSLRNVEPEKRVLHVTRIAFLLGLSVAFKLINVVSAFPIVLLCAWTFVVENRRAQGLVRAGLLSLAAFLAPVLPFSIYLYQEMGSPVFPILNGVFKSPYWPANSGWDARWGPVGFWETLWWPIQILLKPERLSELLVYSGRLSLGLIGALLALALAWRDATLRRLSFLTLGGMVLWSAASGYIRYALFLELLAGALLTMLVVSTMKKKWQLGVALILLGLLGAQATLACHYVAKTEWGGRATIFRFPAAWKRETQYLLRDHSLRSFSPKVDRTRFAQVEIWIESSMKTASLEILLNDKAPVIGLRSDESFANPEGRLRFVNAIERAVDKRMFTLCFAEELNASLEWIKKRGLTAGAQTPIDLPFYSPDYRLPLILIEVSGAQQAAVAMRKTLQP
jgi:hypothetical protein